MKTNLENIKNYFSKNASCLNVRGIEVAAGVPAKTLDHFLKGRRTLSDDSAKKIVKVLKKMAYKDE